MAGQELISQIQKIPSQGDDLHLKPLDTKVDEQQITSIEQTDTSQKFAKLMENNQGVIAQVGASNSLVTSRPSLIEEASRLGGKLSVEEAKNLSVSLSEFRNRQRARLEGIIDKLSSSSEISVRPSVRQHLDSKIKTIDDQFSTIRTQLNLPAAPEVSYNKNDLLASLKLQDGELVKPVEKFLNFIVRGEKQLYTLESEIDAAFAGGDEIPNPGVMLKLQLKMTHVSQQLELFTSMLNKGLESSKTVFNTQL